MRSFQCLLHQISFHHNLTKFHDNSTRQGFVPDRSKVGFEPALRGSDQHPGCVQGNHGSLRVQAGPEPRDVREQDHQLLIARAKKHPHHAMSLFYYFYGSEFVLIFKSS